MISSMYLNPKVGVLTSNSIQSECMVLQCNKAYVYTIQFILFKSTLMLRPIPQFFLELVFYNIFNIRLVSVIDIH